jgi:hypothetical protein
MYSQEFICKAKRYSRQQISHNTWTWM